MPRVVDFASSEVMYIYFPYKILQNYDHLPDIKFQVISLGRCSIQGYHSHPYMLLFQVWNILACSKDEPFSAWLLSTKSLVFSILDNGNPSYVAIQILTLPSAVGPKCYCHSVGMFPVF